MKRSVLLLPFMLLQLTAADTAGKYHFNLAGRDFTKQEAVKIAGGQSDLDSAIQKNFAAAAAIVLFSRDGIELSPERTRDFLQNSLRLMAGSAQKDFQAMLLRENLTRNQWLEREQEKLENQLSEAVLKWYIRRYGKENPVTDEHVQNWYYRNLDIFRRVKLDPAKVWAFKLNEREKMQKALSALRQAVPAEVVRKNYAETLSEDVIAGELHSSNVKREYLGENYRLFTGSKHIFLAASDAISYTALPLDEDLKKSIRNALHEALAKARLAETLKKEFKNQKIIFY